MSSKNKKSKKSKQSHVQTEMIVRGQANNCLDDHKLYEKVRSILDEARQRAARNVNTEMVRAYWLIGQAIVEHEQKGKHRAGYGEQLIESLSQRLTAEVGRGFQARSLWWMRDFYCSSTLVQNYALSAQDFSCYSSLRVLEVWL